MNKIIIVFLLFIVVVQLVTIASFMNKNRRDSHKEKSSMPIVRTFIHQLENLPSLELKDLLLTDESGERMNVKQLHLDGKMVLFISSLNCFSCIEHQLNILKKGGKLTEKVILFTNFDSVREAAILKNKFGLKNKLYNFSGNELLINVKFNEPYYFIFSQAKKADNLFAPQTTSPELTTYYLDYFNNLKKVML